MPRISRMMAVTLLACALLGACTTWQARPVAHPGAPAFVARRLRVTRADGTALVMRNAHVRGDTLAGAAEPDGAVVALALADVRRVEVRRANEVAGVALLSLAIAGVAIVALVHLRPTLDC